MKINNYRQDLLLLLAAIIWGFAFTAQRAGMDYVGPFTYNGVRFTLGTLVLLPFLLVKAGNKQVLIRADNLSGRLKIISGIIATGLLLFGGVAFQQLGLLHTSAGKAGFITGLYVVLVPVAGLFLGHRSNPAIWAGAVLSLAGLYLLSITAGFTLSPGDGLVMCCAVIFTFHVLFIAWLSPLTDSFLLAVIQFAVTAILNLLVAFAIEPVSWDSICQGWLPIAYGGILSVGIAYTLQVIAQKKAHPAHASIILSLEAVFAVIGGVIILKEPLTVRMMLGCILMLAGMMVIQLRRPA